MRHSQLWLFDPPRPLRERLGEALFRSVPPCPGVYVMAGRGVAAGAAEVLYVGKSRNLRRRLGSYNSAVPGRCSRKTVRLVHSVESVTWEVCRDEQEALLRENELIRTLRPRFNRANTWPQGYWYLGWKPGVRGHARLCLQHQRAPDWEWFGAFRGWRGYGALVRWLWRLQVQENRWLPSTLLRGRPSRGVEVAFPQDAPWFAGQEPLQTVQRFLAGTSDALLGAVAVWEHGVRDACAFDRAVQAADTDLLKTFWNTGTRRNGELRRQFGVAESWIDHAELDDLLVLWRTSAGQGVAGV